MRLAPVFAVMLFAAPTMAATIALPADMTGYFRRLALCEKHDTRQLGDADQLLCKELPYDKKALLSKYSGNSEYVALLNAYGRQ